jgi:hypothetical protein
MIDKLRGQGLHMPNEPLTLASETEAPSEAEYEAFHAALTETARGRAFLAEHARRTRSGDTAVLLASVQRLEGLVSSQPNSAEDGERQELRALLDAIRGMHAELDTAALTMQVAKLAALIDVVQQRIETIVAPPHQHEAPAPEPVAEVEAPEVVEAVASAEPVEPPPAEASAEDAPAPEPAADASADAEQRPTAVPEVGWFEGGSAALALSAVAAAAMAAAPAEKPSGTVLKAGTIPPPSPFAGEDFSSSGPAVNARRKTEALAPIMALSEEERLALFT